MFRKAQTKIRQNHGSNALVLFFEKFTKKFGETDKFSGLDSRS